MEEYYFKHSGLRFEKDPTDIDKYIVIACAKNEGDYIVEWVEHYYGLGFDKIIIADNNDVGDDSLYEKVQKYIDEGRMQVFDVREVDAVQVGLYADYCEQSNFKWCAFYDCDEFLDIGVYSNIKEYLEQFINYDVVLLNWLVFGPDGQLTKEDGLVQERFKKAQSPVLYFKENSFVKSLVQGNKEKFEGCFFNGSHLPTPAEGKSIRVTLGGYYMPKAFTHSIFPPKYKNGYIRHYYTKSFEEWVKKASRGWPDGTENLLLSKYLVFEKNMLVPFEFMDKALFKIESYSTFKNFEKEMNDYDVFSIRTDGEFVYPLITEMMDIFQKVTGYTFLFSDQAIDDTLFTILLEYGYATGNRVLFCKDPNEMWKAYQKFGKKNCTYYIITFG